MAKWTKEAALAELESLAEKTHLLEGDHRYSEEHTRWLARARLVLEEVFGRNSPYFLSLGALTWRATSSFIVDGWDPQAEIDSRHHQGYLQQLGSARGLLKAAHDDLRRTSLEEVYRGKDTRPESSGLMKVLAMVEHKLRKVMRKQPQVERDVQDAIENLLIGGEIEHSREKDHIEYSSKTYIPDFSLHKLDLALEVKLCKSASKEKELIAEINDDILAYKSKYGNLIFAVYDAGGFIRDVEHFTASFENHDSVVVRVVKH